MGDFHLKPPIGARLNPYHPLARGLVGSWLFNERGGLIARDSSGHGNHGTLVGGPTWERGALNFDGTIANTRVDLGTTAFLHAGVPFTVLASVNLTSYVNSYPGICRLKTNDIQNWELFLSDQNGYEPISFGSAGGAWVRLSQDLVGNGPFGDLTIAVTYNGRGSTDAGNFRLYRDGGGVPLKAGGTFASDSSTSAIGIEGGNEWNGLITYLHIYYGRAFSSAEVARFNESPYEMFEPPPPSPYYYRDLNTIRQRIVTAFGARMKGILIASGFSTNLGQSVYEWLEIPLQGTDPITLTCREGGHVTTVHTIGRHKHTLTMQVVILIPSAATPATVRKAIADVIKAVGTDVTWSTLAQDTSVGTDEEIEIEHAGRKVAGVGLKFAIEYTTAPYDPYTAA